MISKEKVIVESIDEDNIHVKTLAGNTGIIKANKVSKSVCVGNLLRHCEHGYYDIVDENDNLK